MASQEPSPYLLRGIWSTRKLYIYATAFIAIFIIFLLTSPKIVPDSILEHTVIDDEGNVFSPSSEQITNDSPINETITPVAGNEEEFQEATNEIDSEEEEEGYYKFLLLINSNIGDSSRRKLIREWVFGIRDTLVPFNSGQKQKSIYYRFLTRKRGSFKKHEQEIRREFLSEFIEFDDIVELEYDEKEEGWQEVTLRWSNSLDITYDHLVVIDIHTLINFEKLQQMISGSLIIRGQQALTREQKDNLLWGSFSNLDADEMAVVIGSAAVDTIMDSLFEISESPIAESINSSNVLTKAYYYFSDQIHKAETTIPIHLINDNSGIVEWPNAIESVSPESTIFVGHIFQDGEFVELVSWLNVSKAFIRSPPPPIRSDESENKNGSLSIAIVTSSFVYKDMCMVDAVVPAADNKREYAEKHGYYFVPRSAEFAQQTLRHRKTVWGKVDAVEKTLPHYDWLFWVDMDAVIFNQEITIESLLENFTSIVGGPEAFSQKHFIVAKPIGDKMINAGVFLLRNSEWSRRFLREVQGRKDQYFGKFFEQRAMWDVINEDEWKDGALLLLNDDHTFNTFPKRYKHGDFIVHFAPDGCPAAPVIEALNKLQDGPELQEDQDDPELQEDQDDPELQEDQDDPELLADQESLDPELLESNFRI
ncbi:11830_t:CDS:2 [Ambispora gerdemannii]|uniref:11830_t:CDS:1 n=1 Tax=Ambispora gerdemannii TaxID=144530 RepID=A0A9N8VE59_9GLOM|nr:11830_t:CDS:2 [Ambispora gerdemannii]